jgi:hypothetical protein
MLWAQNTNPAFINMKGKVVDTANTILPMATIMLLSAGDNKLQYFTHTDNDGMFSFNNIKNKAYVLKVTYLSFYPLQQPLQPTTLKTNDLGVIKIKPIAQVLTEVVIKAAQAPITFHGDTIEYNAASFKVPPGSKVEDLLRRLPGINVDAEGNISTQGKSVNTVYVNGNKFFNDNPKMATKNLGAEAVSKIQVYNEKSQLEKLTGIKDADREKVINLALKKEYSNSDFGYITVGVGTKKQQLTTGMYNRFNDKWQLSFVGVGDNTKVPDMGESISNSFRGNGNSYFGQNGDFGFAISGQPTTDVYPLDLPDRRGFVNNYGGGTSYNYLGKKTKIFTNYLFNQIEQTVNQFGSRTTLLKDDNSYNSADTSFTKKLMKRHSFESCLQNDIDSNNNLIARVSINLTTNENRNNQDQLYSSSVNIPLYSVNSSQFSNGNSWDIKSTFIYAHRFKREGQSLSFSAGYNSTKTDNNETIENLNQFYNATTFTEQIRRLNITGANSSEVKSSFLFTQQLFKDGYMETFYNFNNQTSSTDKQADNALQNNAKIDSLSSYVQRSSLFNRLGTVVHITNEKLDLNFGLAGQSIDLLGRQSLMGNETQLSNLIQKNYINLIPSISCTTHPSKKTLFIISWTSGIELPQINDLNPEPQTNNPLFIFYGNPYLKPEKTNSWSSSFNASFPLRLSGSYTTYQNQIVYSQSISKDENSGYKTITRPMNMSGGDQTVGSVSYDWNIYKNIFRTNFNIRGVWGQSSAYINDVLNKTRNTSINCNISFEYSPLAKLRVFLNNQLSYNYFTYSINNEQNQYFINHSFWLDIYYQVTKKIYFTTDMKYSIYQNEQYHINRKMPIWYATLSTTVGKKNHFVIKLSASDILDKTLNIQQTGMLNYFETRYTDSITRRFLLSIVYNLKGF